MKEVLGKMRGVSSAGAEGWRIAELKRLPEPILARLAELLNKIEESGEFFEEPPLDRAETLS